MREHGTTGGIGRRELMTLGIMAAGAAALPTPAGAQATIASAAGRRRLGELEVSSIGLGVQNMHRTYQTTIPYRPEMLNIIRAAHEHGVSGSHRRS